MTRRGPRKLRAILVESYPGIEWPSTTTMSARSLSAEEDPPARPSDDAAFAATTAPNDTWCIDFKGKFRMQDGNGCHVLTLLDADTRFSIAAEAMLDPTGANVEKVLDSAFQEFRLPRAMRSDNEPPFASTGAGRL